MTPVLLSAALLALDSILAEVAAEHPTLYVFKGGKIVDHPVGPAFWAGENVRGEGGGNVRQSHGSRR
ncbi:MAG: hypothetical protein LBV78_25220 [Kitasatospora sp.]|nr:hypothetical protein [Kitasatospora sp.]